MREREWTREQQLAVEDYLKGAELIADVLLISSLLIPALSLLDFLLSDSQKKRIGSATLNAWNFLDELERLSIPKWLDQPRERFFFSLLISTIVGLAVAFSFIGNDDWIFRALILLFTMFIGTCISLEFLPRLMRNYTPFSVLVALAISLAIVAVQAALVYIGLQLGPKHASYMALITTFTVPFTLMALTISLAVAFPLLGKGLLTASEFLVRRIAENPKGPLLAASALFALLVALIKEFN